MAGTETLLQIMQAAQVAAPIGQGVVDYQTGQANADILRTQGRYAVQGAAEEETLARREGRQVIAQQAANVLAEGGGDSSQMDVVRQNEVAMIANALAIRRRGAVQAAGYESKARMSEYEGEQSFYSGVTASGSKLLTTAAERRALERRAATGV